MLNRTISIHESYANRKKSFMKYKVIALFYIGFIGMLLCFPTITVGYAYQGLVQWATRMVPTLFPFMVISSMMIYTGMDIYLTRLLKPVLKPLFTCSTNGLYAVFMGFLCGFPMGAKVICDLLKNQKITRTEAEYLLAFCNNIGPTYFLGIIFPLLQGCGYSKKSPFLFGIYGIPFLYGILLGKIKKNSCNLNLKVSDTMPQTIPVSEAIRLSCFNSIQSILLLGGYVTFVNAFRVIPDIAGLSPYMSAVISGFLEIIHGIPGIYYAVQITSEWKAFWILVTLSFSGLCCMLQTSSILIEEELSMKKYIYHKGVITGISAIYYSIVLFVL